MNGIMERQHRGSHLRFYHTGQIKYRNVQAEVRNMRVIYQEKEISATQFAREITGRLSVNLKGMTALYNGRWLPFSRLVKDIREGRIQFPPPETATPTDQPTTATIATQTPTVPQEVMTTQIILEFLKTTSMEELILLKQQLS